MVVKKCTKCGEEKPASDFHLRGRGDQRRSDCKVCALKQRKEIYPFKREELIGKSLKWNKANKARAYANKRKSYFKHREKALSKQKEYAATEDKDRKRRRMRLWLKNNRHRTILHEVRRRTSEKQSVPSWADLNKIQQVYVNAVKLGRLTGLKYHVDHVVPLQSKYGGIGLWIGGDKQ